MPNWYKPGDRAYIVESNYFIREVKVLNVVEGFTTLRFTDIDGGVKLSVNRCFLDQSGRRGQCTEEDDATVLNVGG